MSTHSDNSSETMINVPGQERTVSLVGGSILTVFGVAFGLARRNPLGAAIAALGGGLLYQGITGHSPVYRWMGSNRAVKTNPQKVSVPNRQGQHVTAVVTIDQPAEKLYAIWRDFNNLPKLLTSIESVEIQDPTHSRWTAKTVGGMTASWDAEIINEIPHEVIAWRSLANSQIANAGSVRFRPAPYRKGTEMRVTLEYAAPGQQLGVTVARWLGANPEQQLQEDLERFKQHVEAGDFKPAGAVWTEHQQGQFKAQDEGVYSPRLSDADDMNRTM